VPETALTCPACGKTGNVTREVTQPATGAVVLLMTGLDPDGCDGCRETLNSHSYAVVDAKPADHGAWALTVDE
jgi:hypothetical protein